MDILQEIRNDKGLTELQKNVMISICLIDADGFVEFVRESCQ